MTSKICMEVIVYKKNQVLSGIMQHNEYLLFVEDMKLKLDTFLLSSRITKEAYESLAGLFEIDFSGEEMKILELLAKDWEGDGPYTQTVAAPGVTAADNPIIGLYIPEQATAEQVKEWEKNFSYINRAEALEDQITFYCYNTKALADLQVMMRVV